MFKIFPMHLLWFFSSYRFQQCLFFYMLFYKHPFFSCSPALPTLTFALPHAALRSREHGGCCVHPHNAHGYSHPSTPLVSGRYTQTYNYTSTQTTQALSTRPLVARHLRKESCPSVRKPFRQGTPPVNPRKGLTERTWSSTTYRPSLAREGRQRVRASLPPLPPSQREGSG